MPAPPPRHYLIGADSLLPRCGEALGLPASPGPDPAGAAFGRAREQTGIPAKVGVPPGTRAAGADFLVAALAAYVARLADRPALVVGGDDTLRPPPPGGAITAAGVTFVTEVGPELSFAEAVRRFTAGRAAALRSDPAAAGNRPDLSGAAGREWLAVEVVDDPDRVRRPDGSPLAAGVRADGSGCRFLADPAAFPAEALARFVRGFEGFCEGLGDAPERPGRQLPLLSGVERRRVLVEWNATGRPVPDACVHQLFEAQAARTPEDPALVYGQEVIGYRELDARANRLARYLGRKGVGPGVLVGLCLERSPDMVIAVLATLKAGGAYVPLDPGYPRERVALMLEDSAARVLVTRSATLAALGLDAEEVVCLDLDAAAIAAEPAEPIAGGAEPDHLAYTLYTSGSTGKPKGVMVRHRNVVNFFVGIDDLLGTRAGTWLAVTSLSFDISVLELLWTLCRGFKVVLQADKAATASRPAAPGPATRPVDFSLMFFASGEGAGAGALDRYRLLVEAAKFGDRNGFTAVWTPERHFFAFGGLYPNPSVASAALATITERIQLRAGSVVAPLHNPIRIAEEWALVDNLSRGRVGVSFASGWQPVDFVLRPEAFADRKAILFRHLETVRRLWRGESVKETSPLGKEVEIRTLPRPVQKELPVWVTAAANPETFVEAARAGANVLTHLLGQKVEEVGEKVALYRKTWSECGHPGRGTVTLMLHTFVGPDEREVREAVRQPMKDYLRSAVSLIKEASWTFPTFKQRAAATGRSLAEVIESDGLSEKDMDALLEHAFERYYGSNGLLGTPESCLAMIEQVRAIDVDEVACLLDFGVPTDKVLEHLPHLLALKEKAGREEWSGPEADAPVAEQIRAHRITHLQCTPSQAKMLAADPDAREALRSLRALLLGGEALPADLLAELGEAPGRAVFNMYGPTETTVWSTAARVDGIQGTPPIGKPLANTRVYVLDGHLRPVPVGVSGELCIGGEGVAAGYHGRPELTAERFPPDPFGPRPGDRMYRTGDRVRYREDGTLEFLGRLDNQVKIRGHRIEPGEIEAALRQHPAVRDAAVAPFEGEGGDKRLAAYLVASDGSLPPADALREYLAGRLPEYMVPSAFVSLPALPLTPNGKVDRKALPAPGPDRPELADEYVAPRTPTEEKLARVWAEAMGLDRVGATDNFFQLGGNSLSAVQLIVAIRNAFGADVPLQSLFEQPSVAGLAPLVEGLSAEPAEAEVIPRRGRSISYPLSYGQERVWFLEELHPGLRAFHEAEALRLRGPLDVPRLTEALNAVVARHEALRTRVRVADGRPVQEVAAEVTLGVKVVDLTGLPPDRRQGELERLLAEEPRRPFDLTAEPGVRVTLARLGAGDHVLVMMQHLMVTDRWSLNILYRELAVAYRALSRGEPVRLPDVPIQYGDFAVWQRQQVEGGRYDGELAFWRDYLRGAPAALDLPIARQRPESFTYRGELGVFPLGGEVTEAVRGFARREGISPFAVLAAALNALLCRYTGQEDIVLGVPMANRERPELASLYGFLIDFQALRTDLSGDPTFRELLARVHEGVLKVRANRDVPFNKVVEAVRPGRDLSRAPLFQVMLTWRDRNLPREFAALEGVEVSPVPAHAGGSQYDLTLNLTDTGDELLLEVEYCTDLFAAEAVRALVDHFKTLLAGGMANPEGRLSALPLLTPRERERLLVEWNDTRADYPRDACVHELFEAQARRTPERVAVVCEGQPLTYAELDRRAGRLAERLRGLGVGPDTLVGLYADRSLEMMVGLLGTLKAGGAYLPLDPLFPAARLALMLEESRPRVILTQSHLEEALPPHSARVLCLDTPEAEANGVRNGASVNGNGQRPRPTSLAYVLYTSGSTGRPKGVPVSHRAVVNLLTAMRHEPGLEADDVLLSVTTLSFDIAALELFLPLTTGAAVVLAGREDGADGARLAALLAESRATVMQATPARWRMLLQAGWAGDARLKALCGGEALSRELADQLLARCGSVWNLYGPTETTIWSAAWRVRPGEPVAIGRPIANTRVYVLDRRMQPVPAGVPGELFIGGDGVAAGYLHRPELTAERFPPDPFGGAGERVYRTGDLVRYRGDGVLEYLGRLDHQAKVRGFRVEAGEIEAALGRHPRVRDRVVVPREDSGGETYLAAYFVPAGGPPPEPAELRSFLRESLPDYMVPSAFVPLERLPLTPNGKVDRGALPAPERAAPPAGDGYVAPRTPAEERLAAVWAELLGRERVGVRDNFFDLGGHSLMAARLFARIHSAFGVRLPLATLFEQATIEKIAEALEGPVAPTRVNGTAPAPARKPEAPLPPAAPPGFAPAPAATPPGNGSVRFYRFLAVSGHPVARAARRGVRFLRTFSVPAPRQVLRPLLVTFLTVRTVYYFFLRAFVCEPFFKAYCTSYGKNLHTGTYLHWVWGRGHIVLGDNVTVDGKCGFTFAARFTERPTLKIGSHTGIGHDCRFVVGKSITIGSHCRIAGGTQMFDSGGHPVDARRRAAGEAPPVEDVRPIVIGDHVWIGRGAIVVPGVTIGEGAIVSAGAVVMSDVAPYTVVAGNPAGKIGEARARVTAGA